MFKIIKGYDKEDWKHVWWLFRSMIKGLLTLNDHRVEEAFFFLKLHLTKKSTRTQ